MSKRDLRKYLNELDKAQVTEQLLELYDKFQEVKTYYDFVFNPKEEKLVSEAKLKIANEYFPIKGKRPKLRRSTAQKYIKHFVTLGVDPFVVADVMLFNLETAQRYSAKREMRYSSFYKSMLNSFEQVVDYVIVNGVHQDYVQRIWNVHEEVLRQAWDNRYDFETAVDKLKVR